MESIERYEQKYLLSLAQVAQIKASIHPFVKADQNSKNGAYTVLSLYLDGIDRPFYQANEDQVSERLKLRIRTYGSDAIFLEIKRKVRGMIWKSRVCLNQSQYQALFQPHLAATTRRERQGILQGLSLKQKQTLEEFLWWKDRYQASPHYWVGYEREGFQSPDGDYARVTFDYRVKARPSNDYRISSQLIDDYENLWKRVDYAHALKSKQADVIMELKSEKRIPMWMSTLTHKHDLEVIGVSKYVLSIDSSDAIGQLYRNQLQASSQSTFNSVDS